MTDLKKLCGERYRVVDDGTDDSDRAERVWCQEILGKHGAIYPCGSNGALAARIESARVANRVAALGFRVVQRGDWETVFVFEAKHLDEVARLIGAKKRRRLSAEQKANLVARLNGAGKRVERVDSSPVLVPEENSSWS